LQYVFAVMENIMLTRFLCCHLLTYCTVLFYLLQAGAVELLVNVVHNYLAASF